MDRQWRELQLQARPGEKSKQRSNKRKGAPHVAGTPQHRPKAQGVE